MAISLEHDHIYLGKIGPPPASHLESLSSMVFSLFPSTSNSNPESEKQPKFWKMAKNGNHNIKTSPLRKSYTTKRKQPCYDDKEEPHPIPIRRTPELLPSRNTESVSNILNGYKVPPKDPKVQEVLKVLQQQLLFLEEDFSVKMAASAPEVEDIMSTASTSYQEPEKEIEPIEEEQPQKENVSETPQKKVVTAKDFFNPPRLTTNGLKIGRPIGSFKKHDLNLPEDIGKEDEVVVLTCRWQSCGLSFEKQSDFFDHVENHLSDWGQLFTRCLWDDCTHIAPYDAYYKIRAHMRHHTKERPFRCNVPGCKNAYSRMENLKTHKRMHSGERPFSCEICGKTFTNASDRANHVKRVHADGKQYFCLAPGCGKSYTDPSSLRKHFSTNHKELLKEFQTGQYRMFVPQERIEQQEGFSRQR